LASMYLEIALIGLQTLVLTIIMIFLARAMARTLLTALLELDHKIAEAIQQMIVELMMNNMKKKEPNIELVRGEDGKFK